MNKHCLTASWLLFSSVLCVAQEVLYTQTHKETEYHYGIIAGDDLEKINGIEKIQHEFRAIESTVVRSIDRDYQTTLEITVTHNDYDQNWMKLASRFRYTPEGATLLDHEGQTIRSVPYTEEEMGRNAAVSNSIRTSGYHPGLAAFPAFTPEAREYFKDLGIQTEANEEETILTLIYPDESREIYNRENLTIIREWIAEDGVKTIETSGYEPYLINKGYLQRIRKTERFLQSANGPCITEVRLIYYTGYEIYDYDGFIDRSTEQTEAITVYPNPNDGLFTAEVQLAEGHQVLHTTITNITTMEQVEANQQHEKTFTVDMTYSEPGNYALQVFTNQGTLSFHFYKR